jgi:Ras family protein A
LKQANTGARDYAKRSKIYVPTVFENYVAQIEIDGKHIELGLWDTAGQEHYDRLRPLSYPKANVILMGFSIDSPDSLDNVFEKVRWAILTRCAMANRLYVAHQWISEVKHFCKDVPILLVGTKKDLRYDQGVTEELRKISQKPVSPEEVCT